MFTISVSSVKLYYIDIMPKTRTVVVPAAKSREVCQICTEPVMNKDSGLQCEICDNWFHSKCENISDETCKVLGLSDTIHWYCSGCNRGVSKILQALANIQARQDVLERDFKDSMKELKTNFTKLEQSITAVDNMVKANDVKLNSILDSKLVDGLEDRVLGKVNDKIRSMREDNDETLEIEKRKKSLIFHGVKESDKEVVRAHDNPDFEMVKEILGVGLKLDGSRHIEDMHRIGLFVEGKIRSSGSKLDHWNLSLKY